MKNKIYVAFLGVTFLIANAFATDVLVSGVPPTANETSCEKTQSDKIPSEKTPCEKKYLQGDSIEFFFLDKLKDTKAVKNLLTTIDGNKVNLSGCSNVIAEVVNNNSADVPEGAYVVKVHPPKLDTLLRPSKTNTWGDYDCFGEVSVLTVVVSDTHKDKVFDAKVVEDKTVGSNDIAKFTISGKDEDKKTYSKGGVAEGDFGFNLVETEDVGKNKNAKLYYLKKDQIKNIPHIEVGMTYGFMYIPFKRYIGGGGGLKDGTTVGAYAGYKNFFPEHSFSVTPVVAFGFANQKYDALDQTTSKIKEFNGGMLSLAVGLTWGFSYDKFKVGFLYGLDNRSSNDPSAPSFNNKWWSIMFGIGIDPSSPSLFSWAKPKTP
jgi:hypothetical protein